MLLLVACIDVNVGLPSIPSEKEPNTPSTLLPPAPTIVRLPIKPAPIVPQQVAPRMDTEDDDTRAHMRDESDEVYEMARAPIGAEAVEMEDAPDMKASETFWWKYYGMAPYHYGNHWRHHYYRYRYPYYYY